MNRHRPSLLLATLFCAIAVSTFLAQISSGQTSPGTGQSAKVEAHWDKVTGISKTTATLQVVVNPPLRRGSPIHDAAHQVTARHSG